MGCQASAPAVASQQQQTQFRLEDGSFKNTCCGSFCFRQYADNRCCLHGRDSPSASVCECCEERLRQNGSELTTASEQVPPPSLQQATMPAIAPSARDSKEKKKKKSPQKSKKAPLKKAPSFDLDAVTASVERVADKDLRKCLRNCLSVMECPICLDSFSNDVCTLVCGHSICKSHVAGLQNGTSGGQCPVCRASLPRQRAPVAASLTVRDSMDALENAVTMMLSMETEARQRCTVLPPPAQQQMTAKIATLTTRKAASMSKEEEAKEEETASIRDINQNGFSGAVLAELHPGTSILMPPVDYAEIN